MRLEHLLLGLIGEKPSTGYEIKRFLDVRGRFLRSNTTMSQVYRSLKRMTKQGWLAYTVDDRPGAQDAKVYRVTSEGMTVFLDWLTGPYSPPSRFQDPEFAARLSFCGFMSREQLLVIIDTELEARRAQVTKYRFRDRTIDFQPDFQFDQEFSLAVGERLHEWGTRQIDHHIEELTRLRQDILDGRLRPSQSVETSDTVRKAM